MEINRVNPGQRTNGILLFTETPGMVLNFPDNSDYRVKDIFSFHH